ncbi:MAG TPA: AMP-binding protein, partial [Candidatus Krumholzibacterium sp.]|nr:AMP-binding protein [Candidatus Krumholzibacterium sp.]
MPGKIESFKPGALADAGVRTLPDLYQYAIENFSSSTVMKKRHPWGYQSISFQEFGKLISFLGAGLMGRGLKRGDRVALMAENSPEWVVMYAAVTSCGATIVPLDTGLQENELRYILLHSTAKMLVVSPSIYHEAIEGTGFRDVEIVVLGEQDSTIEALTVTEIMATGKEKISGGDAAYFSA